VTRTAASGRRPATAPAPNTGYGQYFSGRSLATCNGQSFGDILGSGGPLFYNYNAATGTGTQISVVAFQEPPQCLMGPQFGSIVQGVYNAIQSTTP
jgi:hypothetical protein